jgi:hypothetical protein
VTAGADMFDAARVMAEYNEAKIEAARSGGLVAGGLSIVINSHNRPGPLAIVMEALADWTGPLLVVDDSDDADAIKRVVGDRGQVVRVNAPAMVKVAEGLRMVETEFVHPLCDDDIPNPAAFLAQRDFLLANPGHVLCMGRRAYAGIRGGRYDAWCEFQGAPGHLECDGAPDRMRRLMTGWVETYFGVHRAATARRAFSAASRVDPKGWFLGERLAGLLLMLCGKASLLDVPSLVKSAHGGSISATLTDHRRTFLAPDFSRQYGAFAAILAAQGGLESTVDSLMADHLAYWYLPVQRHPMKNAALAAGRVGAETYAAGMSDADVAACRRMEVLSRRMLAALGEPTKVAA